MGAKGRHLREHTCGEPPVPTSMSGFSGGPPAGEKGVEGKAHWVVDQGQIRVGWESLAEARCPVQAPTLELMSAIFESDRLACI